MRLSNIKRDANVFIDANIFIYHFTGASKECSEFLKRCEQGEVSGMTSVIALLEVLHRLMMVEAVGKKLAAPPNIVKKLQKHPEKIKQLKDYYLNTRKIADMGIIIKPLTFETAEKSNSFRTEYGLMVNDSIIAAGMAEEGMDSLASNDDGFRKIGKFKVYSPGDVEL
ncbi:MAG: PIN domain-containing protein [Deltaproteobacteria bacterium]|nr:PIN domain-containing protein [Deltaproteobacteria bacterium]